VFKVLFRSSVGFHTGQEGSSNLLDTGRLRHWSIASLMIHPRPGVALNHYSQLNWYPTANDNIMEDLMDD